MPVSQSLLDKLHSLEQYIALFKKKSSHLKKPNAPIQQQLTILEKLHQGIKKALSTTVLEQAPQEDDDWWTLLDQSSLPSESKEVLKQFLSINIKEEEAKAYVKMVTNFYKKYYSNQQKYFDKVTTGLAISEEHYHSCLQKAITYTIKKQGKKATTKDFSVHFILLLKGHLKENDLKDGEVEYVLGHPTLNGTQITISSWQMKEDWPDATDWFNKKPPFSKGIFKIDSTSISLQASGSFTFDQGKMLEVKGKVLGDFLTAGGELLSRKIGVSLKDKTGSLNLAAADGKVTLHLPFDITIELGMKVADLVLSISKKDPDRSFVKGGIAFEEGITPIQFSGKLVLNLEQLLKLLPEHPFLQQLIDLKLQFEVKVATKLGIEAVPEVVEKVSKEFSDLLVEQEDLVTKRQVKLLQQEQAYIELAEQHQHAQQLYQERQQLLKQATSEVDPKKKKALEKKAFQKAVAIQKEKTSITKRLLQNNATSLKDFNVVLSQNAQKLEEALVQNRQKIEATVQAIEGKYKKVLANTIKKQTAKRLLSLVAKAIPVLNVVSFCVDAYDVYVLVRDMRQMYQQEDLNVPADASLERLENAAIDVTTLSPMLTDFFYGIGAGGKLLELTPEEAAELTGFFEKEFEDGIDSMEFENFMWAYGDHYEVVGSEMEDIRELMGSVKRYRASHLGIIESIEATTKPPVDDLGSEGKASTFFHRARYQVVEGDATRVGTFVRVDASGTDRGPNGEFKQISFSDIALLKLKVMQDIGDQEMLLQPTEPYSFEVKFYRTENGKERVTTRTYLLRDTSIFVYNKKSKKIVLRPIKYKK